MAVTVSQMLIVKDAKLSIIDSEQGVATKELKWVGMSSLSHGRRYDDLF